ncbi:MAG: flagellar hook-basal body complex protein FliE [Myxococcota bacterium]|nr:flagellar hook-basal body complex protein FliE [Myxococcota bacterium]
MTAPISNDMTSFAATLQRADATVQTREARAPQADSLRIGDGTQTVQAPEGPSFGERVEQLLEQTNQVQVNAEQAAESYANGTRNDMHGTMIALEQADISFRLVSNIRSRLVDAYREVMRMGA